MSKNDDEVLVRVDGVGKKFCRSLKKSLWYGVCDIAGELLPGRKRQRVAGSELRVAREEAEVAGSELLVAGGNTSAGGGTGAQGLGGGSVPQAGPQGFAGRENSEPNLAPGDSGLVTRHQLPATSPTGEAWLRDGEFWAVKDVSFELRRGECLGLIGHNGAGKTTLLKMLNGLIKPDRGTITMRGRVGALIALGAGFNPILTGRENIYINGSVLGLTKKEIDEKIDEIIDFAEIREFIDMPVQSYSSGMQVRLGFAVATAMNPDVLILDEVLAVGDISFRLKCYQRIDDLRRSAAIILVSHNMPDIGRICQFTMLMERGRNIFHGETLEGISRYNKINLGSNTKKRPEYRITHPVVKFLVEASPQVAFNAPFNLKIHVFSEKDVGPVDITVALANATGGYVAAGMASSNRSGLILVKGSNDINLRVSNVPLKSGTYPLTVHIIDKKGKFIAFEANRIDISVYGSEEPLSCECRLVVNCIETAN